MLKKLLFSFSLALTSLGLLAQGYYWVPLKGSESSLEFPGRDKAKLVMDAVNGTVNNQLSEAQTIPFTFNFMGEEVTEYKISENGYITFNTDETTSNGMNVELPSADAPKNAIFGFWDDLDFRQLQQYLFAANSYTVGSSPNRIHCINWFQASSASSSVHNELLTFSIRLHENGSFDIVHQTSITVVNGSFNDETATVGFQNADGTVGATVAGPSEKFPTVTNSADDDIIYHFIAGERPAYDAVVLSQDLAGQTVKNEAVSFNIEVTNWGSETITSLTMDVDVNGTITNGTTDKLNIASLGTATVAIPNPISMPEGGEAFDINVMVTAVNGEEDGNTDNNSIDAYTFTIIGETTPRTVLVEEFSTAPCGFCPDGALILESMKQTFGSDLIVAQHHAGFGTDLMTITEHSTYASTFANGAPTATVDRIYHEGDAKTGFSRNLWATRTQAALQVGSPVKVDVTSSFNDENNTLTADVDLEFVDYADGDIRVTVFVIQKMVQGFGTGFDQRNYYNGGNYGANHPMVGKGDPIIGYWHRDVTRAVLPSVWGDRLTDIEPGAKFTKQYQIAVNPTRWDKSMLEVVAFVNKYSSTNTDHRILNASAERTVSGVDQPTLVNINAIYPNPTSGTTVVDLSLEENAQVSIDVYNTVGQKVLVLANQGYAAGNHTVSFDASNLEKGIYLVNVKVNGQTTTEKLIVE